jgi:SAM-dependent methyltransferase
VSAGRFVQRLRKAFPDPARGFLRQVLAPVRTTNARLRSAVGLEPLSYVWGFDRGLPLHRYYLERFLQEFASDIRGHCLEFQDPSYAPRFGGSAIHQLDVLHIDDSNPAATIVADLTKPNDIPGDSFDCIVCTHVLHVILELDKVIAELCRILKPGGVLLVAVPHISMCDPGFHELWRFTPEGLRTLLARVFEIENVTVRAYGNSLTAAGEIRGLVAGEFSAAALNYHDPRFPVEVCARAQKGNK